MIYLQKKIGIPCFCRCVDVIFTHSHLLHSLRHALGLYSPDGLDLLVLDGDALLAVVTQLVELGAQAERLLLLSLAALQHKNATFPTNAYKYVHNSKN